MKTALMFRDRDHPVTTSLNESVPRRSLEFNVHKRPFNLMIVDVVDVKLKQRLGDARRLNAI